MMRVLIGEISSYKAIVISEYITRCYPNVELWAYDNMPLVRYVHSKHVKNCVNIKSNSLNEYIEQLAVYIKEKNIDIFIPVHSDYIGLILEKKHLFGNSLDYLGTYDDYIRLHEKDQLMNIARTLQIKVPFVYTSIVDIEVPFVIKPTNLSSAKGVRYFQTEEDKSKITQIPHGTICQEYIYGKGCGYEVYCKNGEIISEYGHMRLAEWPISGGSSVLRTGYVHPDMRKIAEKILKIVQWTGFVMFEFKLTPHDQLVLIEVNPRIWGSINQALQNGCPLFSTILGEPLKQSQYEVRTCLTPQVWLSMLAYACKGNLDIIKDFLSHYKYTYSDVSILKDPLGVISMIIRKLL